MRVLNLLDYPLRAFLLPFQGFHPFFALTLICVLFGLFGMVIFRRTTDQGKLRDIQKRIKLLHMEMRFRWNDLSEVFRRQNQVFRLNGQYLRYSLPATIWILVPMVAALIVMNSYFSSTPVRPGEVFTVSVIQKGGVTETPEVDRGKLPPSIQFIEVDPDNPLPAGRHFVFRAKEAGVFTIPFTIGGEQVTKAVVVGNGIKRVPASRGEATTMDKFYFTGDSPLPENSKILSIGIDTEPIEFPLSLFGWKAGWFSYFLILSLVLILVFKKIFSVY